MPKLVEQKVDIGRDAYGRPVTMTRYLHNATPIWRIESLALSQRDDGEKMDGLTDDNVRDMIEALQVIKRG